MISQKYIHRIFIALFCSAFAGALVLGTWLDWGEEGSAGAANPPEHHRMIDDARFFEAIGRAKDAADRSKREVLAAGISEDEWESTQHQMAPVSVRVTSGENAPVPGATVRFSKSGAPLVEVATNEQGIAHIDAAWSKRNSQYNLAVEAQGFGAVRRSISVWSPMPVIIRLAAPASVGGRVLLADTGQPPTHKTSVFAWEAGYTPSAQDFKSTAAGNDSSVSAMHHTATIGDGSFFFSGLADGTAYEFTAVSRGSASLERQIVTARTSGDSMLELTMSYVYAARVVQETVDGGPPLCGPQVHGNGPAWYIDPEFLEVDAAPLSPKPPELAAIVGDWPTALTPTSNRETFIFLTSATREPSGLSVVFEGGLPGYEPVWSILNVEPIKEDITTYAIQVKSDGTTFGSIRFTCSSASLGLVPNSNTNGTLGVLKLIGEEGERVGIVIPKPCDGSPSVITGVPSGKYRAYFRLEDWNVRIPRTGYLAVEVGQDETTLQLPFEESGAVLLDVIEEDGEAYTGKLILRLYARGGWENNYLSFNSAPYVIEQLPAGRYGLAFERVPGVLVAEQPRIEFDVASGELGSETMTLVGR